MQIKVDELHERLCALADMLQELAGMFAPANDAKTAQEAQEAAPVEGLRTTPPTTETPDLPPKSDESAPSARTVSLSEVRAAMARLASEGKGDAARAIIKAHGAAKLSAVAESEYAAMLAEAENA